LNNGKASLNVSASIHHNENVSLIWSCKLSGFHGCIFGCITSLQQCT
jgi:hypothetical protein